MDLEWIAVCKGFDVEEGETSPTLTGIHADGALVERGVLPIDANVPVAVSIVALHSELEYGALATFRYRVLDPDGNVANEYEQIAKIDSPSGLEADLPRRGVVPVWVSFPISAPGRYEIQLSFGDQSRAVPFVVQEVPATRA